MAYVTQVVGHQGGIAASGQTDVISAHGNLLPAVGLPLSVSAFGVGADLLEINAGLALGISQSLFLDDPSGLNIHLRVQETGQTVDFAAGSAAELFFPEGYSTLHLNPSFTLSHSVFHNRTSITLSPDFTIVGLQLCFVGRCTDPVIDEHYQPVSIPFDVYNNSFDLAFNSVQGNGFALTADIQNPPAQDPPAPDPSPTSVPEPHSLTLISLGLAGMAWSSRRKRGDR